ncbi:MAG: cytochrome b [Pseudomonadota bacterium]
MSFQDSPSAYGSVSRLNHWIGALFVLLLLAIGLYFDELPKGDERSFVRKLHIAVGTIGIVFLLFRVFWRLRSPSPLPVPQKPAMMLLARAVHGLLLTGIVLLAISGPLIQWSGGRPFGVFNLLLIPSPFPPFESWKDGLEEFHAFVADGMLVLIGLHVLGVLKHQFIDRDKLLSRMTGR